MGGYTTRNPLRGVKVLEDRTSVGTVAKTSADYMARYGERLPAFVGLAKATGGYYAENTEGITLDRALEVADLTFTMRFEPITSAVITADGVTVVDYPLRGTVAQWPDGRVKGFGAVGERYQFIQPREAGELAQAILDEGGANVVAVGSYGNPTGAKNYLAVRLPEELVIGGGDHYDQYLSVLNSHDGKGALTGLFAPIRRDCTNQTEMTFGKRVANRFTFRHSGDVAEKISEARRALDIAATWSHRFMVKAEELLATRLSPRELDAFVATLLPTPAKVTTQAGENNWAARRLELKQVITRSETNSFGAGTAYAAYNGVVEWSDFVRPVREDKHASAEQRRYSRTLDGDEGTDLKLEAARLLGVGA